MAKKKKLPKDTNVRAHTIISIATGEAEDRNEPEQKNTEKNPHAVALGRAGGKKGGKARAEKLTPEQRSKIAKKAAEARWKNRG